MSRRTSLFGLLALIFLLAQFGATLLALAVYRQAQHGMLLAICQSMIQLYRSGLSLTPSMFRSILDHHKPPAEIRSILESVYGDF